MNGKAAGLAIAAVAVAALAPAAARGGERVDVELVLAVDVSGSVDGGEQELQRAGLAAAFRDPEVVDAIRALPLGVAVALVVWAGPKEHGEQRTAVTWRWLTAPENGHAGDIEWTRAETARASASAGATAPAGR